MDIKQMQFIEASKESVAPEVAQVKRELYARRNGVVADHLRKAGDPHHYIMGCTLVEIMEVARLHKPDALLASELWRSTDHREARLIATMLYPRDEFDEDTGRQWLFGCRTTEEVDILCHKLLRYRPYAHDLLDLAPKVKSPLSHYIERRLRLNLDPDGMEDIDC